MFIDIILVASLHYCLVVEEVLGDCYRNFSSNDLEETNWNPVIDSCHLIYIFSTRGGWL